MAETGPKEALPDEAPFIVFFLGYFIGPVLALGAEYLDVEAKLGSLLPAGSHAYALFGLGMLVLSVTENWGRLQPGPRFASVGRT